MKYLLLYIFFIGTTTLFATKPFSIWQFDGQQRISFDEQECLYSFDYDTTSKEFRYKFTDILTDKDGKLLFSFDTYPQKIKVRDSKNNTIGEVPIVGDNIPYITTILLPFYDKNKCYFVFLISEDIGSPAKLFYFELDYSLSSATLGNIVEIPTEDLLQASLAATISSNKDEYFLALIKHNKEEIYVIGLKPNGNTSIKSYPLETGQNVQLSSQERIRFSPKGNKLIACVTSGVFNFFSFDNSTGEATFEFYIDMKKETGQIIRGELAFSQNGQKLYTNSGHDNYIIHQFDLSKYNKADVLKSKYDIVSINAECVDCLFRDFTLAPNNKIYITYSSYYLSQYLGKKDSTYIGVINCPNSEGPSIDFDLWTLTTPKYISNQPYIPNIPSNFLATAQAPTVFKRLPNINQFCLNADATLKGIDDPCGEQFWKKPDGSKIYTKDLFLENISEKDAGLYFYSFHNCYQSFMDTFEVRIKEGITPEIVKVSPEKIDLCSFPLENMTFTSKERYKKYEWYFTKSGSSNRIQIGNQYSVVVSDFGILELEVKDEGGCEGIAIYKIEAPNIEYKTKDEYEIRLCYNAQQNYSIHFPILSDRELTIDSLSFRSGLEMTVANRALIIGTYSNGNFNKTIDIKLKQLAEGEYRDTLDIYIYSECRRKITLPIKVVIEGQKFTLEIPQLHANIGATNFEIPIYLTTSCLGENEQLKFEATISLSKHKFFLERIEGVELISSDVFGEAQRYRIGYESNGIKENGRSKIGSLFGYVLLTTIDSTGIIISDTSSNYTFNLINGALITNDICAQDLRQVTFIDNQVNFTMANQSMKLSSYGNYRGIITIKIENLIGQIVAKHNIYKGTEKINWEYKLNDLPTGLYFIKIIAGNQLKLNKLFID